MTMTMHPRGNMLFSTEPPGIVDSDGDSTRKLRI